MARTKTQAIVNQQQKPVQTKMATRSQSAPPRSAGKRLTAKQIAQRRALILEMVNQANTEHEKDKEKYLTRKPDSQNSLEKTIKFSSLVQYSTGEQIEVEFIEQDSAKKLMGLGGKTNNQKSETKSKSSQKKRKYQESASSEKPTLKKTKVQTD